MRCFIFNRGECTRVGNNQSCKLANGMAVNYSVLFFASFICRFRQHSPSYPFSEEMEGVEYFFLSFVGLCFASDWTEDLSRCFH